MIIPQSDKIKFTKELLAELRFEAGDHIGLTKALFDPEVVLALVNEVDGLQDDFEALSEQMDKMEQEATPW